MLQLHPTRRLATVVFSLLLVTATLFSQTVADLMGQAKKAYDQKEYAKSAELYMQAYKTNARQLTALYNGACSYALGGEKEKAFAALDELVSKGYNQPQSLQEDTDFSTLKSDPRWKGVVAKVEENAKKNPPRPRWVQPFKILDAPASAGSLADHLGSETGTAWLEGDVLTFLCRSSADSVNLGIGIQEPMKKIPGTDLWILQAQMPGWEKGFVTYGFIEPGMASPKLKLWKGDKAPAMPEKAKKLKGKVVERTIHSTALGEDRKLFIYLPPNAPTSNLPAVFMADGQGCSSFASVLEPLILAHKVRPCAIVGIDNGGYRGDRSKGYEPVLDNRALEYVPGIDADRFDKHMRFFTDEVGAYVAKEFGVSTRRQDRAVTGFSNGGAFSAAVAFRKPEFFGTSMPLSLGVPPLDPKPSSSLPRMFFAGGALESFGLHTQQVYEQVKGWGTEATFDLYVAGHDSAMWELAFATMMPRVFPG